MIDKISQKVVCIGGFSRLPLPHETMPIIGAVYTVRAFDEATDKENNVYPSILLNEIKNPLYLYRSGYKEVSFRKEYFRPLITKEYDLSVFSSMLKTNQVKERV